MWEVWMVFMLPIFSKLPYAEKEENIVENAIFFKFLPELPVTFVKK